MTLPVFVTNSRYHRLFEELLAASRDPVDPKTHMQIALNDLIAPEDARRDVMEAFGLTDEPSHAEALLQ